MQGGHVLGWCGEIGVEAWVLLCTTNRREESEGGWRGRRACEAGQREPHSAVGGEPDPGKKQDDHGNRDVSVLDGTERLSPKMVWEAYARSSSGTRLLTLLGPPSTYTHIACRDGRARGQSTSPSAQRHLTARVQLDKAVSLFCGPCSSRVEATAERERCHRRVRPVGWSPGAWAEATRTRLGNGAPLQNLGPKSGGLR